MINVGFSKIGLTNAEAGERLKKFGLNRIGKIEKTSFWLIAKEEITEPMILLLLAVGFFYTIWGILEDALTILIVILTLVFVEIWNEYRAKKAIAALSEIAAPRTKVLRENKIAEVPSEEVAPGDVLILSIGTRVAADAKIFVNYSLKVDESSLTGESFPQEKKIGDEIYAGTLIVAGEGKAEVFATGRETKIGKISGMAAIVKQPKTPLQLAMKSLTKSLVWISLTLSFAIPLFGFLRGQDLRQMILTGLSLSFATVPEELPIIITMVLGLGAYQLSRKNFLIKKLKAAEVLGNATVILTDKTGTITENKLKVVSLFPAGDKKEIIETALASLTDVSLSPIDQAILDYADKEGIKMGSGGIIKERSFGDARKTRALLRERSGGMELFASGAPEEIFSLSRGDVEAAEKELQNETTKGRRMIAVARKDVRAGEENLPFEKLEKNLNFAGLISFEDPPRPEVKKTIEIAKRVGIRTIMVTGDHPATAVFIAKSVGIDSGKFLAGADLDKLSDEELGKAVKNVSIFARTAPEHKYRLVKALHSNGEIVAATGDGINDTLALKGADIGIAMGIRGTDAAKEAADAVLVDDNFVTIGQGIFEGRKFFDNLSKGIKYYLSVKIALILIFLLPVIVGVALPFAPIQIIILELFMDLAASAGFVGEPMEKNIFVRPPRSPKEKLLNNQFLKSMAMSGLSLFVAVAFVYFYSQWQGWSLAQAQTAAFLTWLMGHIFLAFVSRSQKEPLLKLGFFSNKIMDWWAIIVFAFIAIVVFSPGIGSYFKLVPVSSHQIGLIFLVSSAAIFWQEARKLISPN